MAWLPDPDGQVPMYRVITVPWDGSKTAQRALPVGAALARRLDAELELVHVVYEAVPAEPHREHLEQLRRRHDLPEGPTPSSTPA